MSPSAARAEGLFSRRVEIKKCETASPGRIRAVNQDRLSQPPASKEEGEVADGGRS